ncbi:hypothetical protein BDR07DRAFT_1608349 [Suillus spraguei]|nr:hypothetical protein BDR07DRAFT_1608349 [Suillus spraguei]
MATFGKSSFDTIIYATFRPTYPRSSYDFIFRYHERNKATRRDRAVDFGYETGQTTVGLTPFKHVISGDPSSKVIAVPQSTLEKTPVSTGQYEYVQASAESLPLLEDSSVYLVNGHCRAGPYWQQPSRSILENALVEVPEGNEVVPGAFSYFEGVFFTGDHYPSLPYLRSVIMRKKMTCCLILIRGTHYTRFVSTIHGWDGDVAL